MSSPVEKGFVPVRPEIGIQSLNQISSTHSFFSYNPFINDMTTKDKYIDRFNVSPAQNGMGDRELRSIIP